MLKKRRIAKVVKRAQVVEVDSDSDDSLPELVDSSGTSEEDVPTTKNRARSGNNPAPAGIPGPSAPLPPLRSGFFASKRAPEPAKKKSPVIPRYVAPVLDEDEPPPLVSDSDDDGHITRSAPPKGEQMDSDNESMPALVGGSSSGKICN